MTEKTRAAVTHWVNTALAMGAILVAQVPGGNVHWPSIVAVVVALGAAFGINISTGDKTAAVGGSKNGADK